MPRYRKLRCINNDIKREKKRAVMFDAEEMDVVTKKRKEFKSPPPSPPPSPSPVPQQIPDAVVMNAEDGTDEGLDLKSEAQDEAQEKQKRRRGPVYYHMKLRERLAQRDAATSSSLNQEGVSQLEEVVRPSLFAPPTLPEALSACRISDEDQLPES